MVWTSSPGTTDPIPGLQENCGYPAWVHRWICDWEILWVSQITGAGMGIFFRLQYKPAQLHTRLWQFPVWNCFICHLLELLVNQRGKKLWLIPSILKHKVLLVRQCLHQEFPLGYQATTEGKSSDGNKSPHTSPGNHLPWSTELQNRSPWSPYALSTGSNCMTEKGPKKLCSGSCSTTALHWHPQQFTVKKRLEM